MRASCSLSSTPPSSFCSPATPPTDIYTLSLHDALPISPTMAVSRSHLHSCAARTACSREPPAARARSEEHTSELQSRGHLVCRLLLEKKKNPQPTND